MRCNVWCCFDLGVLVWLCCCVVVDLLWFAVFGLLGWLVGLLLFGYLLVVRPLFGAFRLVVGWLVVLLSCGLIACLGCLCFCCFWFDCLVIVDCLVNYLLIVCALTGLFDCLLFSLLLLFSLFSLDCYLWRDDWLLLRWWFALVGVRLFFGFVFIGCWFVDWL